MGEGKAAVAHSWLTLLPARQITDFHTADCGSCIDADQMLRNESKCAGCAIASCVPEMSPLMVVTIPRVLIARGKSSPPLNAYT